MKGKNPFLRWDFSRHLYYCYYYHQQMFARLIKHCLHRQVRTTSSPRFNSPLKTKAKLYLTFSFGWNRVNFRFYLRGRQDTLWTSRLDSLKNSIFQLTGWYNFHKAKNDDASCTITVNLREKSDCASKIGWLRDLTPAKLEGCSGLIENEDCSKYPGCTDLTKTGT